MGSFRSQPELTKQTHKGNFDKISFAVSHMCGNYPHYYVGWRIYMEDAHISTAPFSQKKVGLFGVFDGHGGNTVFIQGLNVLLLLKGIFRNSFSIIRVLKREIIRKHLDKPSSKWTNCYLRKQAKNKLCQSKNK